MFSGGSNFLMRHHMCFFFFFSLYLFVEGYMYNHPHQAKRAISTLRAPELVALLQNKMEKSQTRAAHTKEKNCFPAFYLLLYWSSRT